jgi:hypothetical protein
VDLVNKLERAARVAAVALAMNVGALACVGDRPDLTTPKNESDGGSSSGGGPPDAQPSEGHDASTTDAAPDAPAKPRSTYCEQKLQEVGSAAIFCADFDEPTEPLAAYVGASFSKTIFQKEELLGGSATLVSGSLGSDPTGYRLVTKKPAQGTADSTGARYVATMPLADALKGLRVELDMIVTRPSPHIPLTIFTLMHAGSKIFTDFEDNNGNPALIGVEPDGTKDVLRATVPIATLWHVDMVIDPSSLALFTLSGAMNGVPMKDNSTAVTSKTVKSDLDQTLGIHLGILAAFAGEGETTIQYDNVLVRTLR